ncbi:MAG TPA: TlpA family protein disulfide reductase [Butyricimonas virosa]|uniref:TlpA family protein disulfide reductase n=1 Tax=Butyricimonas virosa TaxID=544645 RepID=A0A921H7X0_9BACT|nr:TlpA family protein disulfide reductase [Butyricimonas virosa]
MMIRIDLICCVLMFVVSACNRSLMTVCKVLYPMGETRAVEWEMSTGRQALVFTERDSMKEAVIEQTLQNGKYARLWVGAMPYTVWIEPGKAWIASFKWNKWSFEGKNFDINHYLNTSHGEQIYFMDYYRIPNSEFRAKLERVMKAKELVLQEANLDSQFTGCEMKRLRYIRNQHLACGVVYGEVKDGKMELMEDTRLELQKAITEDSTSWEIFEYRESVDKALLALAKMDGLQKSSYDIILDMLNMAVANYKDQRLIEYLVNKNVMEYIKAVGVEDSEELDRIFREQVRDTGLVAAYDKVYDAGKRLTKGQPAVPFTFEDMNGNAVSLSDFRGKYVYIDLWATWCGPCVAEIPHLQKLEKHFHGRNICFVSISSDKDRKVWMKYVQGQNLSGIQLHMGENKEYMKEIHCEGIPRFLLIDQEGNFINANMTRPSDLETWKVLEGLAGI